MSTLIVRLDEDQLNEIVDRIVKKLDPTNRQPLSVAQASKALGLSRWIIESRVQAGTIAKIPGIGRRILIPRAEIDRLQEGQNQPERSAK